VERAESNKIPMARRFYTACFYLLLPVVLLRLLLRSIKSPAYGKRIAERFGYFKSPVFDDCIWVHAVSVGEVIAAAPMIKQLQARYPEKNITVTTMTPTGSERVRALFGDTVFHVFVPYDIPACIDGFLKRVQPCLLIIVETELWPNMIACCVHRDIPSVLVNARLSEKSAVGYQRFSALTQPLLRQLSCVAAQHQADADRFMALGLSKDKLHITGSIKFDIEINERIKSQAQQKKTDWSQQGKRFIWIAASTHEGEEEILLNAHKAILQDAAELLLILVPRHPERFNHVAKLSESLGLNTLRYSSGSQPDSSTQVVIADVMGELLMLYGCADLAFVGGSLIERGGHNPLEPAAWGLPIITGSSDYNFSAISQLLQQSGALRQADNSDVLENQLRELIADEDVRLKSGLAAAKVVANNRGALTKVLTIIDAYL
jgi:3-deoxy-D-manno-octulosonic-acid transferase